MAHKTIKVVIPSHKRAGQVLTHKIVSHAALCVPDSQADDYARHYPGIELIVHSDEIVGLSPKHQWIYDQFGDVCMLDDDLRACQRVYTYKQSLLTPDEAYDLIQWAGNVAHMCGCYLFAWTKNPKPMHYVAFHPIELSGMLGGCAMGLLAGSKIVLDNPSTAVQDFWVSAINAHFHRKIFRDTRFNWIAVDTFTGRGGMSEHRTLETEKEDNLILRRYFGSVIIPKADMSKGPKSMRTLVKNPYARALKLPW